MCGEAVNELQDYRDLISDKAYSPREYVEHQLNMSEEEKEARTKFFDQLFAEHDRRIAEAIGAESP